MLVITAVRDRVAGRFLGLQLVQNDKVACRGFVNAMADVSGNRDSLLATNPHDFDLWYLGQFDDEDGVFFDNDSAHILMTGRHAFTGNNDFALDDVSED